MATKTLPHYATATTVAVALSLATVTAPSAAPHWGAGAAVGAGIAGFALGAAAATAASPYYGYYDYAPGATTATRPGPWSSRLDRITTPHHILDHTIMAGGGPGSAVFRSAVAESGRSAVTGAIQGCRAFAADWRPEPIEGALEDISGGVLIDHSFALGPAGIRGNQRALHGSRG